MAIEEEKLKILKTLKRALGKKYNYDNIMHLGVDDNTLTDIEVIPTGSLSLDKATQIGGWPKGRLVEIYGDESAGKSSLCLHAIAQCQAAGGTAAFIDAEQALDLVYAEALGVDTSSLIIAQPDFGEQALDIVDVLVKSNQLDMIVVDSVTGLQPKSIIEGDINKAHIADHARLMSKSISKLVSVCRKTNTLVLFTNQIRMKVDCVSAESTVTWRINNKERKGIMQSTKTTSIGTMFNAVGFDHETMDPGTYDVSDKNLEILSYNKMLDTVEFKPVTKLMYKGIAPSFTLSINKTDALLCGAKHKILCHRENKDVWMSAEKIFNINSDILTKTYLDNKLQYSTIKVTKNNEQIPMLDIEVADNHNYIVNGVVTHNSYGDPRTTSGGNALKFFASIRARISRSNIDEKEGRNIVKVKIEKNKLGIPFQEANIEFIWGIGIDKAADLIDICLSEDIIELGGSWYKYKEQTWQGKKNFCSILNTNPNLWDELYKQYRQKLESRKNEEST
ncbi:MAG: hypothetical protein ABIJ08_07465 [Nanoarchaeota archaeon]